MGIWERKSGKLATSYRTELHQEALPLLQIRWSGMVPCRDLDHLDRCGIDLVAPGTGDPYSCVVQCKGFDGQGPLDATHLKQIFKSIDAFEESGYRADDYVLLHTKDARSRDVEAAVEKRLEQLVASQRIQRYFVWNRQTFIADCIEQMTQLLWRRLEENANVHAKNLEQFFRFANIRISPIPARQQSWRIDATHGASSVGDPSLLSLDGAHLRQRAHKMRFSCLLGAFGSGKTTLALEAASGGDGGHWHLVFAPARNIREVHPSQGASLVHRQILQAGDLLQDLPDSTAAELTPYAADTLRSMLQNPEHKVVLCVDGLDESPALDNVASMVSFVNALGELRCPVLLATRREHFDATFGNFAQAADQLSPKGGFNRDAEIYELLAWSDAAVRSLIGRARDSAGQSEQPGLFRLEADLNSGRLAQELAGLYQHPLFLQMLLDASARSVTGIQSYHQLIPIWAQGKIERDLLVGRRAATLSTDTFATIGALFHWMEDVAALLLRADVAPGVMLDDVEVETIAALARRNPMLTDFTESDLLTTSLLIPTTRRSLRPLRARFFHRVFQEYFTARACVRAGMPKSSLPRAVQRWFEMARAEVVE
jgi:hypothetical protein